MKAFVALIAIAMAVPAVASESRPTNVQAETTDESAKKPRKICKRELTSTGLHGSRRVCLTAAQWKQRNRNAEESDMGGVTARN